MINLLGHQLNRYGEHDGAVLLRGDGCEGLQVPQLESCGALRDDVTRLLQGLARLLLSLSSDNLRKTLSSGLELLPGYYLSSGLSGSLSLSSHSSLQILRKPDVLHLNSLDLKGAHCKNFHNKSQNLRRFPKDQSRCQSGPLNLWQWCLSPRVSQTRSWFPERSFKDNILFLDNEQMSNSYLRVVAERSFVALA